MKRDVKVYIKDILESIRLIKLYSKKKSLEDFSKNIRDQDAIVRRLEIIGEAIKAIPKNFKSRYPEVRFREFEKVRDFLSHVYFGVNIEKLYLIIERDLPVLEKQLLKIKDELR